MKCPQCGYDFNADQYNAGEVFRRIEEWSASTQSLWNKISIIMRTHIPSLQHDTNLIYDQVQFLRATQDVDEELLAYCFRQYLNEGYFKRLKGYPYLRGMVMRREKDFDALQNQERKQRGTPPPQEKL